MIAFAYNTPFPTLYLIRPPSDRLRCAPETARCAPPICRERDGGRENRASASGLRHARSPCFDPRKRCARRPVGSLPSRHAVRPRAADLQPLSYSPDFASLGARCGLRRSRQTPAISSATLRLRSISLFHTPRAVCAPRKIRSRRCFRGTSCGGALSAAALSWPVFISIAAAEPLIRKTSRDDHATRQVSTRADTSRFIPYYRFDSANRLLMGAAADGLGSAMLRCDALT